MQEGKKKKHLINLDPANLKFVIIQTETFLTNLSFIDCASLGKPKQGGWESEKLLKSHEW